MNPYKVAIISPNPRSLQTTTICELLMRKGIKIEAIIVKKFTLNRFKKEFSRDGLRLIKKIWEKLILRELAYKNSKSKYNIVYYRKKNNISLRNVFSLKSKGVEIYNVNDLNSPFVERTLKKFGLDLVVFTGGGIIRKNILDVSGAGVLNCHMGKLPDYRGMDVVEWPIINKDFKNLGFTVHFMDEGIDTGDILKVYDVEINEEINIKDLREKFVPLMAENFVDTIEDFLNSQLTRVKQNINDGKQYFIVDKLLYKLAERKLYNYSSSL